MKKVKFYALIAIMALVLTGFGTTAAFAQETSNSAVVMKTVTLAQHTSYNTDSYFGVIKVSVDNKNVAAATSDSQGHVVVTAIASGTTTVRYWYKPIATATDWTSASLPITVSGTVAPDSTVSSSGLVFSQSSVSLANGSDYTVSGIMLNGSSVNATGLLWVSSSGAVAAVDSATGKITAVGSGTAVIYAIDPASKAVANINVNVS